jgi:hypothetical protein
MSHRTARPVVALLLAAAAAACGGGEKAVVDNYFNAVRAKDNQTVSSFAAVDFTEPVESWKVQGSRDEASVPATLPQLSSRMKTLEGEVAANKKAAGAYHAQRWQDIQKINEAKQKGAAPPAALSPVAEEWDKFNQKDRELKKQLASAKQEMEKEKRSTRLSVGPNVEGVEDMQGEVHTKHVDVEVTSNGQPKQYLMTLRKYELKREQGGPRPVSRWIIQDLKPKT